MSSPIDLTTFTERDLDHLVRVFAVIRSDEEAIDSMRAFGHAAVATLGGELARRRMLMHRLDLELDSGVFLGDATDPETLE
jgi:hypothetical protein